MFVSEVIWWGACGQTVGSPPPDSSDGPAAARAEHRREAPEWTSEERPGSTPDEVTRMLWSKDYEGAIRGGAGGETLMGTDGTDIVHAGGGSDVVRGLGGPDGLDGGKGRDRLYGGPGDDFVNAQDGPGGKDEIDCGPGDDQVLMDGEDGEKPRRCETVGVGYAAY